jgi:ribosomal protein S18 acetylase RimI-like enzyme
MMMAFDSDNMTKMHVLLVTRGVIEPLSPDDYDVQRWLDCELASLVEGHFHVIIDPGSLNAIDRQEWERRATCGHGLRDPRREEFRKVYWLRDQGERVGTLGIASTGFGGPHIGISSLYVRPEFRRRGIAPRVLDEAYNAALQAGGQGLYLDTNWSWQPAVQFYLRLGLWVRNWKHSLLLMRSQSLCEYRVGVENERATFSAQANDGTWTPLFDAEHRGDTLGWFERDAVKTRSEELAAEHYLAPGTFALHLALRGWPLVRSVDDWARRYDWCDMGMPEGLAYKIAVFEAIDRERRFDVRAPRIPGLDYSVGVDS